jgi:hypothetical protein
VGSEGWFNDYQRKIIIDSIGYFGSVNFLKIKLHLLFCVIMETDQIQEISRLRSLNLSPKEIARSLKLRPAEVKEVLQQQAMALELERTASGIIDPLYKCMVNVSGEMLLDSHAPKDLIEEQGFAQVFVARTHRQQLSVCSYLVDYWCLGVKNALGPKKMSKIDYESMVQSTSHRFHESFMEITLEQAQSIVFGSVDYAAKLGIEPHADFSQAEPHLGLRPETLLPIEFGKNGKPFYINGPYDDSRKIIAKLNQSVGKGNYDYLMGMEPFDFNQLPEFR